MTKQLLAIGIVLCLCNVAEAEAAPTDDSTARAVAELEKLGIRVKLDRFGRVSHVGFPRGADAGVLRGATMYLTLLSPFKSLGLSGTEIRDDDLAYIAGLDVKILYLHETKISSDGMKYLQGMRDLRILWLFKTKIDDPVFDDLKPLPKLNYIHVYDTAVCDEAIRRFVAVRPKCSVIR